MKYKVFYYDKQGNIVNSPEHAEKAEVHILDSNGTVERIQYYSIKPKGKEKLLSV